eukprot:maker-scaffold_3-snap-gene-0.42-mRNA-1 protein AED:0.00 eAED:0.00 QI:82/1/1/1/1/1/2/82/493
MKRKQTMEQEYDLIVIGGGSAGLTAAKFSSSLGYKTCIVEKGNLGGDCTWFGCVPSKSLLYLAKNANIQNKTFSLENIIKYIQNKISTIFQQEDKNALKKEGIDVFEGEATLFSQTQILIKPIDGEDQRIISSKKICLATGAEPIFPNIFGFRNLDPSKVFNHQTIWEIPELPENLLVLGGGPIGCELSQAFNRLGSKVTLCSNSFLPKETRFAAELIQNRFEAEGMKLLIGNLSSASVRMTDAGMIELLYSGEEYLFSHVLYAVGRKPKVIPVDQAARFSLDLGEKGGYIVDKFFRCYILSPNKHTSQNIFCAGDCIDSNPQFTHNAGKQGFVCARNALLVGKSKSSDIFSIPRVTFTDPEIASVGFPSVEVAKSNGFSNAVSIKREGLEIDRAVTDGAEKQTLFELILSNDTSPTCQIIGCNIVAPSGVAGEVLCTAAVGMRSGQNLTQLAETMLPYPTYAMGLIQLAADETIKRFSRSKTASIGKKLNFF